MSKRRTADEVTRLLKDADRDLAKGLTISDSCRKFGGGHAVVGSWMVNGYPCGIGLREDDDPITQNNSRFLPHLFRKSLKAKPPLMDQPPSPRRSECSAPPRDDPLWDRWLDR